MEAFEKSAATIHDRRSQQDDRGCAGEDDPDDLYKALAEDYGHRLLDTDWEDLLAEKNIEGWEFKASLRLGELGRSFLQVDRFLGAAD